MINTDYALWDSSVNANRHKKPLQISSYEQEETLANKRQQESKTDTDIIVKPDGSRVLLMTTRVCGMQTTMSVELSKPTAMYNDISEEEEERTIGQISEEEEERTIGQISKEKEGRTRDQISGERDTLRTRGQMSKAVAAYEHGYLTSLGNKL